MYAVTLIHKAGVTEVQHLVDQQACLAPVANHGKVDTAIRAK